MKLAIDFGTTNSVVARWNGGEPEIVGLPGLSTPAQDSYPPVVPSLLYVQDGRSGQATTGQAVRDNRLDRQRDNRLFRNFKRGIIGAVTPAPPPRRIDGVDWGDHDAGRKFMRSLLDAIPGKAEIEQLALTAPITAFEGYLTWLNDLVTDFPPDTIHIVDESTAAALGYAVTEPGAVVLVFDFGGGTLDLSLVQLPEKQAGGLLHRLLRSNASHHTARVIAKAGRVIGGSDIDQWLLGDVLKRAGLSVQELDSDYTALLTLCEQAKIVLSSADATTVTFEAAGQVHNVPLTRADLEMLLEENGFYTALRRVVDKVMHVAHQRGIFKEDITHVLMVGGTSLMPSVQATLRQYFSAMSVRADKPFTAIAEGALQVAAGFGLDDYLAHSYGIRHLDPQTGAHRYDEIIPMGKRYPFDKPVEVVLGAAHQRQTAVEFVIGEIDGDAVSMVEVQYENGQAVFVAQADHSVEQIIPLNETNATQARLKPAGRPGEDRLKCEFTVDSRRQLRLTVADLKTGKRLIQDCVVVTLK